MALADYFGRSALAASQAIAGFDPDRFRATLDAADVGIAFGPSAHSPEGRALLDLTVRLLARLYPTLAITGRSADGLAAELADLARAINPAIGLRDGPSARALIVGDDAPDQAGQRFYLGSEGWSAAVATNAARPVGRSDNPIGAGVAACLGAANLFRAVFLPTDLADHDLRVSVTKLVSGTDVPLDLEGLTDRGRTALAGVGAIGNAAVWALARAPLDARIHLVDDQPVELSNAQRYVLITRDQVGQSKVTLAAASLSGPVRAIPHGMRWPDFVRTDGYAWDRVLVGLDTKRDRCLLQASLPRWIANGWTQVAELGLSTHRFDDPGPCLACLYLPRGGVPNEDEQVATALGLPIDRPHLMLIRDLLYRRLPAPPQLLAEIAAAKAIDPAVLEPYIARPLRDLYSEGVCGGGVIRLGTQGPTNAEQQVPLAHQSALAGVLVAAAYLLDVAGVARSQDNLISINPMRRFPSEPTRIRAKDERGLCICTDPQFLQRYREKYASQP